MRSVCSIWLFVVLVGCKTKDVDDNGSDDTGPFDPEVTDEDVDTDADADADADTDADSDTDADADADTDTGEVWEFGLDERPANPTCLAPDRPASTADVVLTEAFPGLSFDTPVALLQAPGDDSRWFVVEKIGRVSVFDNVPGTTLQSTFIDLTGEVAIASEAGLLAMAFHPDFTVNREVFLHYNAPVGSPFVSRVSRFLANPDGSALDAASEEIILEVDQPYSNHNGGALAFGPDGYLYLALGDGGAAGDPLSNGQDPSTLLGSIVRIDVDGGDPYAIPVDNPFASPAPGAPVGAPEVYAWGLRNPWKFSFDMATGDLWAGDVGQYSWEEVNRIELGGNYGWNLREGAHCYSVTPCDFGDLIDPVIEYPNVSGASVVVGPVVRGSSIPSLDGVLLYTDFYSGEIWGLTYDVVTGDPDPVLLGWIPGAYISAFGQDIHGEALALSYFDGRIYRIEAAGPAETSTFPDQLSATGCVEPDDPSQPVEGMIPYDLNAPLWSDGADKTRWMALPDGNAIAVDTDGDWHFPVGSVLLKSFHVDGVLVETRLLVRHDDGNWAGYPYVWNDAGTDATVVQGGAITMSAGSAWTLPSTAQCLQCHTEAAGRSLGLETGQLNRVVSYPNGRTADQLVTLDHIGLFTAPLVLDGGSTADLAALAGSDGSVNEQARAYLHANCSMCHRPGGPGGGEMDLRYHTEFDAMGLCGSSPEYGDMDVPGAMLLAPGNPDQSLLSLRMSTLDARRMPPLASRVVDAAGLAVINAWIEDISPDCETPSE